MPNENETQTKSEFLLSQTLIGESVPECTLFLLPPLVQYALKSKLERDYRNSSRIASSFNYFIYKI
ncbi:hypothetical protein SOASR014_39130 [Pectobacterium carotovorum subsp. carotovorum]|nr:hypothetical protein SOASR014_39130 [Pectobacterium carotovorum subsp. carotovorum]GLX43779.1 hypothetical protein Pcaca01_14470 [Pectobacterium carotovorum subsp. carotovorum]